MKAQPLSTSPRTTQFTTFAYEGAAGERRGRIVTARAARFLRNSAGQPRTAPPGIAAGIVDGGELTS